MLPINVKSLIDDALIENNRIEFKKDWNPEKILHTICAFANDMDNIGGGYIVVGVEEIDGRPSGRIGIDANRIPAMERELFKLCNLISPRYVPIFSHEKYNDSDIVVIWASTGESRPYKCPVTISDRKNERGDHAYYIRRMSNTVCANREEEMTLMMRSRHLTFDNMVNESASTADIMRGLVNDYLSRVKSNLRTANMSDIDLYRDMRIIRGPPESIKPVNVGLMLFNDRPERFFENMHIEVVEIMDPTGEGIVENVFDGPLDDQLRKVLSYVRSMYIREMTIKIPTQAESIRVSSYPYEAVEEVIVNAVYHRDYRIPEPVKVTVYKDRMEIYNRPGPDRSISDQDIKDLNMRCESYRNSRLGDYLKELRLTEGRNTGIPRILRSLEENGSGRPIYETDEERRFTRVTIPIHDLFLPKELPPSDPKPASKYRDPTETRALLLESLRIHGCQTTRELATSIGYKAVNNTLRRILQELMDSGEVEYLYPDNPKDRRQRICLPRHRCGIESHHPSARHPVSREWFFYNCPVSRSSDIQWPLTTTTEERAAETAETGRTAADARTRAAAAADRTRGRGTAPTEGATNPGTATGTAPAETAERSTAPGTTAEGPRGDTGPGTTADPATATARTGTTGPEATGRTTSPARTAVPPATGPATTVRGMIKRTTAGRSTGPARSTATRSPSPRS